MLLLFKAIWPFVSEMFFGGKSIKEVVLANKLISFLLVCLGLSLFLNYVSFAKIYELAVANMKEAKPAVSTPASSAAHPAVPPSAPASRSHEDEVRDKLQNIFK